MYLLGGRPYIRHCGPYVLDSQYRRTVQPSSSRVYIPAPLPAAVPAVRPPDELLPRMPPLIRRQAPDDISSECAIFLLPGDS